MLRHWPVSFVCLALLGGAAWSSPDAPPAQFSVDDLKKVEADRDEALKRLKDLERRGRKADRELSEIDRDLIAAAADSRRHEVSALETEARLDTLIRDEEDARAALLEDEDTLEDVLATLMTFAAKRPPAMAASPADAGDAIRAAILMGDVAPKLAARADELATQITQLASLQDTIRREQEDLRRAEQALIARRQEIEALFVEKRALRREISARTEALETQSRQLADDAESLRALLSAISNAAPRAPSLKPPKRKVAKKRPPRPTEAPEFRGSALPPVAGELILSFGDSTESQLPHRGQTWQARHGAQVIAPRDSRIEYAGPFRSYGEILILDAGDGYLVVLAGMGNLYGELGQSVLAGEPIGRMSDDETQPAELYIEVRRHGDLIDPAGWLGKTA